MMTTPDDLAAPTRSRARYGLAAVALLLVVALVVSAVTWYQPPPAGSTAGRAEPGVALAARPAGVDAVIVGSPPSSWDPAAQSDYGSASTIAQVFEGLTAVDAEGVVQPALAESWRLEDGGRRLVFTLAGGPDLLRRQPDHGRRRGGQLASPRRSRQPVAAGLPAVRRRRGQRPPGRPRARGRGRHQGRRSRGHRRLPPPERLLPGRGRLADAGRPATGRHRRLRRPEPAGRPGRQRRLPPDRPDARLDDPRVEPPLLGRRAGAGNDPDRQRPRGTVRGRGVRGGRHRLRPHLGLRRRLDRLRQDARATAPPPHRAGGRLLRLRHDPSAVR